MPEEYENTAGKKKDKGCTTAIIIVLIIIVGFLAASYKLFFPVNYHYFNEKRIAEVEEMYKISLDDAVPVSYRQILLGHEFDLILYTDDHKKLMDTFTGYSMEFLYEEPSGSFVQYKGSADGEHDILVQFDKVDNKKGKYKGVLQYIIETHR